MLYLKYSKALASWALSSSVFPYFKDQVVHWFTLKLKTTKEYIIRDKNIRSLPARGSPVCEVSIVILNYSQLLGNVINKINPKLICHLKMK